MLCQEFERRLHDLLDRRRRPELDSHLQAHAHMCRGCRQLLDGQERLFFGLQMHAVPQPPAGFASRVVSRAQAPGPAQIAGGKAWTWLLAAAAGLALLLGPLVVRPRSPEMPAGPPIVVAEPPPEVEPTPAEELPAASLPEPWHVGEFAASSYWQDLFYVIPEESFESVDHLAGGLRPIASSFNVALDAIRRTLPMGKDRLEKPQAGFGRWSGGGLS